MYNQYDADFKGADRIFRVAHLVRDEMYRFLSMIFLGSGGICNFLYSLDLSSLQGYKNSISNY